MATQAPVANTASAAGERDSSTSGTALDAARGQTSGDAIESAAAASIILIPGGNFRLLNRLLTQVERNLEINALPTVTKEVVDAARESLVIGQA